MPGILAVFDHLDGEAVLANRGENVDSTGLHCWPGFVWMPASLVECAGVAEAAGSGSQAKGFIVSREKSLPLHFDSYFLCIKPPCLE